MDFHYNVIKTLYPDLPFDIVSTHGFGGFTRTFDDIRDFDEYTRIIIIYDSGANFSSVSNVHTQLLDIKQTYPEIIGKTYIFKPYAFEELLFSFVHLDKMAQIDPNKAGFEEYNHLKQLNITGESIDDIYLEFESNYSTIERAFEKLLFNLTDKTKYKCSHSGGMSRCWVNDCCYNPSELPCPVKISESKIEYIISNCVGYALAALIDSMLGYTSRPYNLCRESLKRCVDKL